MTAGSTRPHDETLWTTRSLLAWMAQHFGSKGLESPRVVAEMLLGHVLGCERMRLYMEVDRPADPQELAALRALVARAAKHEPVQYLVGEAWFYGLKFAVDSSTLIPRPSTETLVEHVLRSLKEASVEAPLIADIGTGTGCIAICLARHNAAARIIATDLVPGAIELAKRNATAHGVAERIEWCVGDGVRPLQGLVGRGELFDVICSNPPYIPDDEWDAVPDNVKLYEPASALRGGVNGLNVIERLIAEAPAWLKPGGELVLEIADSRREAVLQRASSSEELRNVRTLKDHEGLWRVLVAQRE